MNQCRIRMGLSILEKSQACNGQPQGQRDRTKELKVITLMLVE